MRLLLAGYARLTLAAVLSATLLFCLAPGGPLALAQTDPATPTASLPPDTDPQATDTPTPGAATEATAVASTPCQLPCLVSIAVTNSPVYTLASSDSPRLAAFAAGVSLQAVGMDETSSWVNVQIAPYTTGWIEHNNLNEPLSPGSLPVVATPVPRLITPTPTTLSIHASVEYNGANNTIAIWIRGDGFQPNEVVRLELYNPNGRLVQRESTRMNRNSDRFAQVFILGKYIGGTYKTLVIRQDGSVLEKTFTVKAP